MDTIEMDVDHCVNNGPLVIQFQPGRLKEDLAAVAFAAALVHYKITYLRRYGGEEFYTFALDLADVTVPNEIETLINPLVRDIEKTWTEWCLHLVKYVYVSQPSPPPDSIIDCFDQIVWLPGGAINYEQTAKNLVNCDKITNKEKYQIACAYCLVDDVERLKQAVMQDFEEFDEFKKVYEGFLNYWGYRLSVSRPENALELLNSINGWWWDNEKSTTLKPYDEWAAIEYCFDQLDNEYRCDEACSIVSIERPRVTLNLLRKLTGSELDLVFKRGLCCKSIMLTLTKKIDYFEYALLIWKRMVYVIHDKLLNYTIATLNNLECDRIFMNHLLLEMWRSTSERQKNYIISREYCEFTGSNFSPNFPLILDFLSHCNPERKYDYWSRHWPYLVVGQLNKENRSFIDRIMKLCIVDDQKIKDFKKTKMIDYGCLEYRRRCKRLIDVGRIKEIQSYLEFCTSDSQVIRDMKRTIISGIPKGSICECVLRWDDEMTRDFHQYLDDIFTENESKEFLNEIITHIDSLKVMCKELKNSERLADVMKTVEKFASSEENLIKVKRGLFGFCRMDATIEESVIIDLMAWCMNADKSVVEKFKNVLSDEDIAERSQISEDNVYDMYMEYYKD